jgi:hypothetical protein
MFYRKNNCLGSTDPRLSPSSLRSPRSSNGGLKLSLKNEIITRICFFFIALVIFSPPSRASKSISPAPADLAQISFSDLASAKKALPPPKGELRSASEALSCALDLQSLGQSIQRVFYLGYTEWNVTSERADASNHWRITFRSNTLLPAAECTFVIDSHGVVQEPNTGVLEWQFYK